MEPEVVNLNLEGEICPYTLILALKKVKEIESDLRSGKKILKLIIDHPPAVDNFPGELQKRGFKTEFEKIETAKWVVTIKA
jgi:TusA-related sulfurtransferase